MGTSRRDPSHTPGATFATDYATCVEDIAGPCSLDRRDLAERTSSVREASRTCDRGPSTGRARPDRVYGFGAMRNMSPERIDRALQ